MWTEESWGLGPSQEEERVGGRQYGRFLGSKYSGALNWFSQAMFWRYGWKRDGDSYLCPHLAMVDMLTLGGCSVFAQSPETGP